MSEPLRIKRATAAVWTSVNPVLALAEPGLETDTRKVKYGDGATAWTSLAYADATPGAGTVTLVMLANMATASLFYRKTAGAGPPEVQTLATLKTDLGLSGTNTGDQTTISGNAGTATKLATARNINGTAFDGTAAITLNAIGSQALYVASRWYSADFIGVSAAGQAQASNTIRLQAFLVRRAITISDLWVKIGTVSSGGNVQAAIYAASATTQMPSGSALATTSSISTTTAAVVSGSIPPLAVTPGLYWFATNSDNSTVVLQSNGTTAWAIDLPMIGTTTLANVGNGSLLYTLSQTFGTWPNLTGPTLTEVSGTLSHTLWGFKVSVGG